MGRRTVQLWKNQWIQGQVESKVIAGLEGVFANETMGAFQLTRVKDQVCVRPWDSVTKVTENKK